MVAKQLAVLFLQLIPVLCPEPLLFPIFLCSRAAQCRRRVCAHTECSGRQRTSCPFIVRRSLRLLLLLGACSSLFHSPRSLRVAPQRPNDSRVVTRASPHLLRIVSTLPVATRDSHLSPKGGRLNVFGRCRVCAESDRRRALPVEFPAAGGQLQTGGMQPCWRATCRRGRRGRNKCWK